MTGKSEILTILTIFLTSERSRLPSFSRREQTVRFLILSFCLLHDFNVYMDGVVREENVRVLGKGLELLSANGDRFEINQLLFADDIALVADSEEKLCRLVSEFGGVC